MLHYREIQSFQLKLINGIVYKTLLHISLCFRSVANRLSEVDQQRQQDLSEDIEMGSVAEDELLNEKFSRQGTSTGKISGRKKVVSVTHK